MSRFEDVERLYHQARKLDAVDRKALLDEACAGDPQLRREVEELMEASAGDVLDRPVLGADFTLTGPQARPERIGPFTILDTIGQGGMGIVYLAEQDHPKRRVALKVIRTLLADERMLHRFEREAELLGRLRHPGIAQIYAAGLCDDIPFIAMELIDGQPLMEAAAELRLDVTARLRLFAHVCDAVEHAHRNGVIHRDLKPSNVLVETRDGEPRPRILDFGVARARDADLRAGTLQTSAGELVGTIEYMSPEQAGGDPGDLDTRSDVYSLGVLLYELLSTHLPYDLKGETLHGAAQIIREHDARPLGQVAPALAGDLSTIAGKALEKDKARRYASARALGDDIRRYLDNRPIEAHPPSAIYHLRKFARRHRALVTLAVAVFLSLVLGLVTTLWQWIETREQKQIADRRFEDVRQLASGFIFDVEGALRNLPGTLPARRLLVQTAIEYLDRLATEARDDLALLDDLIGGYAAVGDILGAPSLPNLGDVEGAKRAYRQALALIDRLAPLHPHPQAVERNRVLTLMRLGDILLWEGDLSEALATFRTAEQVVASLPEATRTDRASVLERLGNVLLETGSPEGALEHYRQAEQLGRAQAGHSPDTWESQRMHAVQILNIGTVYERMGRYDEALVAYRRFLDILRPYSQGPGANAVARRDIIVASGQLADLLAALDRANETLDLRVTAVEAGEALVSADPGNAQALLALSEACNKLGELHLAGLRLNQAKDAFDRYLELAQQLPVLDQDNATFQRRHAVALYKQAEWHRAAGSDATLNTPARRAHFGSARSWLQRSLEVFVSLREQGRLAASDAGVPDELRAEISQCDTALAELSEEG